MFIAVSSFGESLRRVTLTAPAEAILIRLLLLQLRNSFRTYAVEQGGTFLAELRKSYLFLSRNLFFGRVFYRQDDGEF